jgi:hypothetical protein
VLKTIQFVLVFAICPYIVHGTFVTRVYFRFTNTFDDITVLKRTYFLDAIDYLVYYLG